MRRLTKAGRALRGRRCSPEPNEQAPAPVHASSLYRAMRQGWGPHGQPPSWLLPADSPGRSWPLSLPERHGCHSTSKSTPTAEVTARAQIARARLGLVTKRCLEVPPECMQGGSLWPGRALERQRSWQGWPRMSAKPQDATSGRGSTGTGEKVPFDMFYRVVIPENVLGDMVGCTRGKGVLDVSVRPRSQGRG